LGTGPADGGGGVAPAGPLERALLAALRADPPDPAAVEAARLALVQRWDEFAWQQANRWHRLNPQTDPDDWHGFAVLGLWQAALEFDPLKGNGFSTFAQWKMRALCNRYAQQEAAGGVHVPAHHGVTRVPVTPFGEIDAGDGGDFAGTVAERETHPGEVLPDEAEFWSQIDWMLDDPRHRLVLRARFVDKRKLDDIAAELGVSKERVRQIEVKALAELSAERELLAEVLAE